MRILVTGGAGFIGSHLVERLLSRNDQVVVVDDLSTGSLDNLAAVAAHPRLEFFKGSAGDARLTEALIERADAVVHLAASVGVRLVVEQSVRSIENNLAATRCVLDAAAKRRLRVLLASSSEVYGASEKLPFCEDDPVALGPTSASRWSYACTKALDEWLGLAFFREQAVPVTVARLFNTVGPRQSGRYGMVFPRFVAQALAGEPLTVHGTGAQTRCFSIVHDTVEALLRLLDAPASIGKVVNVGSSEEVAILELARRIVAQLGSSSRVVRVPYERVYGEGFEDPPRRVPDLTRLVQLTGFRPGTNLDVIIHEVAGHLRASETRRAAG